ncbi:MAG: ABC transporter permease subunit [Micromonosporaceae bacterium]|nr:ABC transporter permease subunit [Micromonosporaceae bacterium]
MDVILNNRDAFFSGFLLTLQLCVLAGVGSLLLGTVLAVLRISPVPPLRWLGTSYVNVFRNVPLTVVFFFVVFALPTIGVRADFLQIPGLDQVFTRLGIQLPYFRMAIFALMLYTAAFVCEALRSGVNAVPPGQAEAARSIGLTFTQNVRHVVLPQAWKAAVVPLGSVIIAMIKNSALAGFFGLTGDLSATFQQLVSARGQAAIPVFLAVAAGFLVLTIPLGLVLDQVERRQAVTR